MPIITISRGSYIISPSFQAAGDANCYLKQV
jgi:hypothetical protein